MGWHRVIDNRLNSAAFKNPNSSSPSRSLALSNLPLVASFSSSA
ncbi:hypothetical protein NC652_007863 [Populus alba x Populus x berolinensis]|nr:hypothetical protein NC652_007863 [Populus alba x Populus x berolinensis]